MEHEGLEIVEETEEGSFSQTGTFEELLMFRLNNMQNQLDELVDYKRQVEEMLEGFQASISNNPMLQMFLGGS